MTRNARPSKLKLFCSGCGAKAQAACACAVAYLPAHVAAAIAVAEHPEWSDRAIANETGIPRATLQRARKSTGSFGPVDKRIGLDGRARSLPRHGHPTPESEQQNLPHAKALIFNLTSAMNAMRTEGKRRPMSPDMVGRLAHNLRNIIDESCSPVMRAYVCERCALDWKVGETKLNENVIDAVRKAAQAWSDLLERMEAANSTGPFGPVEKTEAPLAPMAQYQ